MYQKGKGVGEKAIEMRTRWCDGWLVASEAPAGAPVRVAPAAHCPSYPFRTPAVEPLGSVQYAHRMSCSMPRALAILALFGVSFGFVEAAVVVYLRAILEPVRAEVFARAVQPSDAVFPLLTSAQLERAGSDYVRMMGVEVARELATLLMLTAAGFLAGRSFHQWLAGFMIAFGLWDIFYYVFLKVLLGWPASLGTWDILFLIPVPWTGPVVAPVIVAASMIGFGAAILWCDARGQPLYFGPVGWSLALLGSGMIVVAFCWDWRNVSQGGWPNPFNWPLFALGEAIGASGFIWAMARPLSGGPSSV